ncbi:MAG: hypothetical protein ETSY2_31280 [Candidatus Entotheonella gemina]|uniref:Uncharacterized protein n=1 Tax=Candidatus Entotheonella gemina TaxID=1429439 RepID=W4M0Y7_9BACT|nr:MAG: hypothetical protein ETSY2_31280 [Candidatus Entotheonella gemina]
MEPIVKLNLTPEDLNLVLVALSHLPYRQVYELIERIRNESGSQLLAARADTQPVPQEVSLG